MTITGQSALPKDQIDQMVRDAEAHADEDRRRRAEADARNNAENLLYQTEKLVKDNDDKISAEHKAQLEEAQGKVRDALNGTDSEVITKATEDLMRISQEIGQAMYAAGAADQSAQGATGGFAGDEGAGDDEDIVDAEVVDEGDDQGAA